MARLEGFYRLLVWSGGIASAALIDSSTLQDFSSLVVFGDSYTDDGTEYYTPEPSQNLVSTPTCAGSQGFVQYVLINNQSTVTSTGGRIWPQYIQQYTGINLYDYAVSGAVCDAYFSPAKRNGVKQNQVPYFLKDKDYVGGNSLVIPSNETIYAIWIGTNDLGPSSFFTDNRLSLTLLDYVDCVYEQLDTLHEAGARNFVLLNLAPLNYAPMYALPENGGTINTTFWKDEGAYNSNVTQVSEKMRQYVALLNTIYDLRTPEEVQISDRYPSSSFTIFDVHSLLSDIWDNPASYLNGTVPVNVTSTIAACGAACNDSDVRDSYLWYDSLHPSEQTDRIIAREFVDIVAGNSTWGRTWKSPSS